ncbi:MAG TPA: hypothetical protein VL020_06480 [Pseudomonadales bacterium]|nr:hypothetical protein [Gammaproteobacteria bacterium]HUH58143.1 hypothetical protein [Pseudomonadales bacterium]
MDNLKVFKKMGRFIATQITVMSNSMQVAGQPGHSTMGLENRLIVDAWNTLTDSDCLSTTSTC